MTAGTMAGASVVPKNVIKRQKRFKLLDILAAFSGPRVRPSEPTYRDLERIFVFALSSADKNLMANTRQELRILLEDSPWLLEGARERFAKRHPKLAQPLLDMLEDLEADNLIM